MTRRNKLKKLKKKNIVVNKILPIIQSEVINKDNISNNTFSRSFTNSSGQSYKNSKKRSISGRLLSKSNIDTSQNSSLIIYSYKDSQVKGEIFTPKKIQLYLPESYRGNSIKTLTKKNSIKSKQNNFRYISDASGSIFSSKSSSVHSNLQLSEDISNISDIEYNSSNKNVSRSCGDSNDSASSEFFQKEKGSASNGDASNDRDFSSKYKSEISKSNRSSVSNKRSNSAKNSLEYDIHSCEDRISIGDNTPTKKVNKNNSFDSSGKRGRQQDTKIAKLTKSVHETFKSKTYFEKLHDKKRYEQEVQQKPKKGKDITIQLQKRGIIHVKKNERNSKHKAKKTLNFLEKKKLSNILNKSIRTIYEDQNESLDQTRLSSNLTNTLDKINLKLNDSQSVNCEEKLEENLDFDYYLDQLYKLHGFHQQVDQNQKAQLNKNKNMVTGV